MTTYYKVLSPDGTSLHGGDLEWSLPTRRKDGTWKPGKWHTVTGDVVVCQNGLHLTTEPGRWYTIDCVLFEAEGKGASDCEEDKTAFQQARLLRPVEHPQWWLDALEFIKSIPDTPFMRPDGNPLPEWKLFTADTLAAAWDAARAAARDAAGDAARAAAGDAAGDAAWDAAWDAARDAAGDAAWAAAGDAARAAAGDAARAAAGDAARAAAWDAARAAAWDAALYTRVVHICSDLELEPRHIEHAKARWQVWQKGYCLWGDVDGVLYVYAVEQGGEGV